MTAKVIPLRRSGEKPREAATPVGAPASPSVLDEPLTRLLPGAAKKLATELGARTVGDLLRHYPRRYTRRGELTDLASLRAGEHVTVLAEVRRATTRQMRTRRGFILEVEITDGHGTLALTFFAKHKPEHLTRRLRPGRRGLFSGKLTVYRGQLQLAHPNSEMLDKDTDLDERQAARYAEEIIPIYPATKALQSWQIRDSIRVLLDVLPAELADPLPERLRARYDLPGLREALIGVHRPDVDEDWRRGFQRLRWDEAFVLQVVLAKRRLASGAEPAVARVARPGGLLEAFDARLPFTLTNGQREVCDLIERDLSSGHPMHRLLQGEVGSGKTVVAVRAMLTVVDAGGQAVLLAPTEVLAQQHHRSIRALLGPLAEGGLLGGDERGTRVTLLTGSLPASARRQALLDIASGQAGIVVGTHALLEDPVEFFDLGLVVIDEQHRFGVEQRDALRAKAAQPPHVLVMTATPIPRTVAMTVFGDLSVTPLLELPPGRAPIATHVVPALEKPRFFQRAWERVREEVGAGRQAFVVCPRIGGEGPDDDEPDPQDSGESDDRDERDDALARRAPLAVLDVAPMLADGPLHGLRLGVLHGRLPAEQKDTVMRAFAAGEIDVLVATTVVEVGVDVPNASTMVVLDADRFGVSQLHQLRGRIGRGAHPGLCLLVTDAPPETPSRQRLDAVAATTDGFELAELDLAQRREGDVLGTSQSGRRSSLRLLSVIRDEELIVNARRAAEDLLLDDPDLAGQPALVTAIEALVDQERAEYLEKT